MRQSENPTHAQADPPQRAIARGHRDADGGGAGLEAGAGAAVAVDVRTPCPALWEHNPHLTPLAGAEEIACGYPLIHRSNTGPWHFIHGFTRFLAETLGVAVEPGEFKGDIHLSPEEKA